MELSIVGPFFLRLNTSKASISEHVFEEGEVDKSMVVRNFRTTTTHGAIPGKTQTHLVEHYNLDVIISVGYRVKSQHGTQFRIWATGVFRACSCPDRR